MSIGHEITRRSLLAGFGASLTTAAVGAAVAPAAAADVRQRALDPAARFEAARVEFIAAAEALYPDIDQWTSKATEAGVLVFGFRPPKPVPFTGYGVYEINLGKTRPIVAMAASGSGAEYRWQLAWQRPGEERWRLQAKVNLAPAETVTIVRKLSALA